MKKLIAILISLIAVLLLSACNANDGTTTTDTSAQTEDITTEATSTEDEETTATDEDLVVDGEQNLRALQAYGAAIRDEISIYYPLISSPTPSETYFSRIGGFGKRNPSRQALVDMDNDGIEELVLVYNNDLILLHFENDVVYGTDFDRKSMDTIYTDGSFTWSSNSDVFGYEYGISRVSFVNGVKKVDELCRVEGVSKFFVSGMQVTEEQYNEYVNSLSRTPVEFSPYDSSFLDKNELKAIELACAHWGIKDGDFDPERGFRYRVVCSGKMGELYTVSLYRFVYNNYYEHLEIAYVNIDTEEITTSKYPDGKG